MTVDTRLYKYRYVIEMRTGQDLRRVDADVWRGDGEWLVFLRKDPAGGPSREFLRVMKSDVVSISTERP